MERTAAAGEIKSLKDPAFIQRLQELRQTDNVTNLYYLARTWVFIAALIAGTIFLHQSAYFDSVPIWAKVVLTVFAIIGIGAGQHQLTGLGHEASHHTLLKHRFMNDLVSDWFCMFPMFSSTHHYRLQHMAHHQFVNDPERDPDVSQLQTSGHWLTFPIEKTRFLLTLAKQLWIPNLIKYIRVRAKYNSIGTNKNPYLKKGHRPSKVPVLFGIGYMLALIGTIGALNRWGSDWAMAIIPALMWAGAMIFYSLIPTEMFHQSRVHPVISNRIMTLLRITFITILFTSIGWLGRIYGLMAPGYFLLLWVVPILTAFSFFMILRQIVQHGNGGRGFLTNTRVFKINPLINFCVFPMGQDYHLPHHMYATVPHYRLRDLHQLLSEDPGYAEQAVVVEGYFVPKTRPPENPTVLDVLAADNDHASRGIYIDNSVLDMDEVDEKDQIVEPSTPSSVPFVASPNQGSIGAA